MGLQALAHEAAGIYRTLSSGSCAGAAASARPAANTALPTAQTHVTPTLPAVSTGRLYSAADASSDGSRGLPASGPPIASAALAAALATPSVGHGGRSATAIAAATATPAIGEAPPTASAFPRMATATTHTGPDGGAANASSSTLAGVGRGGDARVRGRTGERWRGSGGGGAFAGRVAGNQRQGGRRSGRVECRGIGCGKLRGLCGKRGQ